MRRDRLKTIGGYIALIALLSLLAMLSVGCRGVREVVEVPVYIHDTARVVSVQTDSVYVERWHSIEVKGDTVIEREREIRYRKVVEKDTVREVSEVPVETVRTVETVKVEKIPFWHKLLFYSTLCLLIVLVAYSLRRNLKKK